MKQFKLTLITVIIFMFSNCSKDSIPYDGYYIATFKGIEKDGTISDSISRQYNDIRIKNLGNEFEIRYKESTDFTSLISKNKNTFNGTLNFKNTYPNLWRHDAGGYILFDKIYVTGSFNNNNNNERYILKGNCSWNYIVKDSAFTSKVDTTPINGTFEIIPIN